jgi:hypothetical protein
MNTVTQHIAGIGRPGEHPCSSLCGCSRGREPGRKFFLDKVWLQVSVPAGLQLLQGSLHHRHCGPQAPYGPRVWGLPGEKVLSRPRVLYAKTTQPRP